jgi:hypothetical protein
MAKAAVIIPMHLYKDSFTPLHNSTCVLRERGNWFGSDHLMNISKYEFNFCLDSWTYHRSNLTSLQNQWIQILLTVKNPNQINFFIFLFKMFPMQHVWIIHNFCVLMLHQAIQHFSVNPLVLTITSIIIILAIIFIIIPMSICLSIMVYKTEESFQSSYRPGYKSKFWVTMKFIWNQEQNLPIKLIM